MTPSLQARVLDFAVRMIVRRRSWGPNDRALAQRARRVFGAPRAFRWVRTMGVRIEPVEEGSVRGEWVTSARSDRGVLLDIHGGGYVSCSPGTHRPITAALARLTERRVFSLDYRLAPEHRYPAAVDDAIAAYRWLLAQGVRPESLALAGDSAGGGLVLATMLRARDIGIPLPSSAVCFSPWTDLAGTGDLSHAADGRCAMFCSENMPAFASAYLGDASARDPFASPVYADLRGLPPLLLQVGGAELLLDDARRVYQRALAAGGRATLEVFDGMFHGWQMLDGIIPEARRALRQASTFVNANGRRA